MSDSLDDRPIHTPTHDESHRQNLHIRTHTHWRIQDGAQTRDWAVKTTHGSRIKVEKRLVLFPMLPQGSNGV